MFRFWAGLIVAVLCCASAVARAERDTLVLGRISDDPKTHYAQLKPLLDYVVPRMRNVGITRGRILMARDAQQMASYLRRGQVDWVSETTGISLWLQDRSGSDILLRAARGGRLDYRTVFFVRKDSRVENLSGLLGQSIAFQNAHSTTAYFVPAYELLEQNLPLEVQSTPQDSVGEMAVGYLFARSERNIATWVTKGVVTAGVMSDEDWASASYMPPAFRDTLKVIHVSPKVPRALEMVSPQMPEAVRNRLTQVLMAAADDPAAAPALQAFFHTTHFAPMDADSRADLDYLHRAVVRVKRDVE